MIVYSADTGPSVVELTLKGVVLSRTDLTIMRRIVNDPGQEPVVSVIEWLYSKDQS